MGRQASAIPTGQPKGKRSCGACKKLFNKGLCLLTQKSLTSPCDDETI